MFLVSHEAVDVKDPSLHKPAVSTAILRHRPPHVGFGDTREPEAHSWHVPCIIILIFSHYYVQIRYYATHTHFETPQLVSDREESCLGAAFHL